MPPRSAASRHAARNGLSISPLVVYSLTYAGIGGAKRLSKRRTRDWAAPCASATSQNATPHLAGYLTGRSGIRSSREAMPCTHRAGSRCPVLAYATANCACTHALARMRARSRTICVTGT